MQVLQAHYHIPVMQVLQVHYGRGRPAGLSNTGN